ncbi:hypothetical protein, partial [Bacteroides caccae]|uniref:hypothetical protein n=1 Tax=Bacteroides caccae TaxID=47678 RepID=UPI0032C04C65
RDKEHFLFYTICQRTLDAYFLHNLPRRRGSHSEKTIRKERKERERRERNHRNHRRNRSNKKIIERD